LTGFFPQGTELGLEEAYTIKTTADWDRTLKANQGKQVQLAVLRDGHQQTLTLQVDNKRHK
jgi:hypothetical protein